MDAAISYHYRIMLGNAVSKCPLFRVVCLLAAAGVSPSSSLVGQVVQPISTIEQQQPVISPSGPEPRKVSWLRLLPNIASDQKQIWLFPVRLAQGRHIVPTLAVVSTTALLIGTDAHSAPHFRRTDNYQGFNSVFTGKATEIGTWVAPLSLYAAGWIARDSYTRETALLAGQAVASAEILTTVMKDIDRRRRPAAYGVGETMDGSWFNSSGKWYRGRGSFPSGHTIAAFSVATVIARRYPRHRKWLPYVGYGLAGLVGFSRVTQTSHFPSDVFMGGALGYSIGRFAVLRN